MKKFFLIAALFCSVALTSQAQEFKPFRVDAGIGYGLPFTDGLKGGVGFYAEPKYEVIDKVAVGVRWEGMLFGGEGDGVKLSMSSAYMATADYYFNNNKFRPFAGIGLGAYQFGGFSASVNTGAGTISADADSKTNFGGMVRAGFDFSHIRLALSYNYGGKALGSTYHYLGINLGFYIGGGKK